VHPVFTYSNDLKAAEKISRLMAKREGKITIIYESGWNITFEK